MTPTLTPEGQHYQYTNQDCDERQAVLSDLRRTPLRYLEHPDAEVCQHAAATWDAYHMDAPAPHSILPTFNAHLMLARLYRRLRVLAVLEDPR